MRLTYSVGWFEDPAELGARYAAPVVRDPYLSQGGHNMGFHCQGPGVGVPNGIGDEIGKGHVKQLPVPHRSQFIRDSTREREALVLSRGASLFRHSPDQLCRRYVR